MRKIVMGRTEYSGTEEEILSNPGLIVKNYYLSYKNISPWLDIIWLKLLEYYGQEDDGKLTECLWLEKF